MVELVDTPDLGSGAAMRVSSSLIRRTYFMKEFRVELLPRFKEAPFTYSKVCHGNYIRYSKSGI